MQCHSYLNIRWSWEVKYLAWGKWGCTSGFAPETWVQVPPSGLMNPGVSAKYFIFYRCFQSCSEYQMQYFLLSLCATQYLVNDKEFLKISVVLGMGFRTLCMLASFLSLIPIHPSLSFFRQDFTMYFRLLQTQDLPVSTSCMLRSQVCTLYGHNLNLNTEKTSSQHLLSWVWDLRFQNTEVS